MSMADKIFIITCNEILLFGSDTKNQKVRPVWEDGSPAYTIKTFGIENKYNLQEEFPALTLRPTNIKAAIDEILWIYQKKSNNVNDLNSHIWDQWADDNGSIGKAYGYQVGKKYLHHKINHSNIKLGEYENLIYTILDKYPSTEIIFKSHETEVYFDQTDSVLYDLKHNPFSRRIMFNLWNQQEAHEMNLEPCAFNFILNVTEGNDGELYLNGQLNQRSQDILVANNWNVVQYSALLMMLAQVSNMKPGILMHCITDAHIYDRHIDLVKELIKREQFNSPKVILDQSIKNFYDFTPKSFTIEDYKTGPQIKKIPVAK